MELIASLRSLPQDLDTLTHLCLVPWHTDERKHCYDTESGTFLILLRGMGWGLKVYDRCIREIEKKRSECDFMTSKESVTDQNPHGAWFRI